MDPINSMSGLVRNLKTRKPQISRDEDPIFISSDPAHFEKKKSDPDTDPAPNPTLIPNLKKIYILGR